MTTPRDDIAGLSEWLSGLAAKGGKGVVNNIDARSLGRIAAQLDSLLKERDALQARVKELEAHNRRLGQGGAERYWENRYRDEAADNARLQQERDEAYERAAKVADRLASDRRKRELDAGFSPATARPAAQAYWCEEIGDAIRRLAGPEKS